MATIIVGRGESVKVNVCVWRGRCVKAKMGQKKLILEFSDLHPSSGFGTFPYEKNSFVVQNLTSDIFFKCVFLTKCLPQMCNWCVMAWNV